MDPLPHDDAGADQDRIEAEESPLDGDGELELRGWYGMGLSRVEKAFIAGVCLIAVLALVMAIWDFSGL